MARPVQEKSVSGATSATAGSALEAGARISVMMYVVAKNVDTANDTVTVDLEVSQDDEANWAKLRDGSGTQIGQLTISEFDDPDGDGDAAAYLHVHGVAAEKIRANLTTISDAANGDLSVDAFVGAYGSEPAQNFRTV